MPQLDQRQKALAQLVLPPALRHLLERRCVKGRLLLLLLLLLLPLLLLLLRLCLRLRLHLHLRPRLLLLPSPPLLLLLLLGLALSFGLGLARGFGLGPARRLSLGLDRLLHDPRGRPDRRRRPCIAARLAAVHARACISRHRVHRTGAVLAGRGCAIIWCRATRLTGPERRRAPVAPVSGSSRASLVAAPVAAAAPLLPQQALLRVLG